MENNVLKFYLEASKLKETIRTGWKEVGIPAEKIESVADHIFGCLVLTIGICSEYDYSSLDLLKVFKMLFVKELTKKDNKDNKEQNILNKEDKVALNEKCIKEIFDDLEDGEEYIALYDESLELKTLEAKFVLYVSKLESDIQAKKYEINGDFTLENALKDVEYYPENIKREVKPQVENASDGWILFDRRYYDDANFIGLSEDIQKLKR